MRALLAFARNDPPPLELGAVDGEPGAFWIGRPSKVPYAIQMAAAAACGLIGPALYLSGGAHGPAIAWAGILIATTYPFVAAHDWLHTEYQLSPDAITTRRGSRTMTHLLSTFDSLAESSPLLAVLPYRHLHLVREDEDGEVADAVKVPNLPRHVANGFLNVLEILADGATPLNTPSGQTPAAEANP